MKNAARIPELDGLRGIAILSVVCIHYINGQGPTGGPITTLLQKFVALGWSGVDLFFVLSGFLIGGILLDARGSPNYFKTFYVRRFFRIIPIYYAWVLLYVLLVTLAGHVVQVHSNSGRPEELGAPIYVHFLFLQNVWPITLAGLAGAWLTPTWSLAVEEQFYLVCPWMIRFISEPILRRVLLAVIVAVPLLRLGLLTIAHVGYGWVYSSMPCRADALAIGILAAMLWRDARFKDRLASHRLGFAAMRGILGAGVLCLLVWSPGNVSFVEETIGYTWIAMFYATCVLTVLFQSTGVLAKYMRVSWLRSVGVVSYCVYLIHGAVDAVCHGVLLKSPPRVSTPRGAAVTLLAAVLTYVIARLSWQFFERPLLERGHRFKYAQQPKAVASDDLPSGTVIG